MHSAHDKVLVNFTTTLITVSTTRARAWRVGVRGSQARYKARTNNKHGPATSVPPQNKFGRPNAVQALFVYVRFVHSPAGNKKLSNRPSCTRHDKRGTEAVKKIRNAGRQKWLCVKAKHLFIFQLKFCFYTRPCAYFFKCCSGAFGVTCCRGHKQKVLALRFNLEACRRMPGEGRLV